jgi:RNA polymerase sigma-70 factor (ECF subfamily)
VEGARRDTVHQAAAMSGPSSTGERVGELAIAAPRSSVDGQTTAAFDRVFLEHYPRVVGIIGRVVGDRAKAEQLASDVFWKLFRHGPKALNEQVGAWLYRAAVSAALDGLRVAARRSRHESAAALERVRLAQPAADPLGGMLLEERRAQVRATLVRLKRRDARLLLLRAGGLSYQEIAQTLDLNPRSVGTLLSRAEIAFEREHGRPRRGQ